MINDDVTWFNEGSVAVYITVVEPMGNVLPVSWFDDNWTTPELSLAVGGVHVTVAVGKLASVLWSMFSDVPWMCGLIVSVEF